MAAAAAIGKGKGKGRRGCDESKNAHLKKLENASEKLQLFKADLLDYNSVASAIAGCEGVFHVASPVPPSKVPNPEEEVLKPAVNGTLNVLKACAEAKVRRVVVVSSCAAVGVIPNLPKGKILDENYWSDKDYCRKTENWYFLSKTLAESEALDYAEKNGLDVVTVCPSLIIGPLLQSTVNASSLVLLNLLKGARETIENKIRHIVDVRDVASALLLVYEKPEASGRYICAPHNIKISDLIDMLKRMYPNYNYPKNIVEVDYDEATYSSEKLQKLGWKFRLLEESLRDSVEYYKAAVRALLGFASGHEPSAPSDGAARRGGRGRAAPALHYLNSPFGDTTRTKVFVGGLAWQTQSEGLRRHFERYGEILEAVVISDRYTGRSKGYGFVSHRRCCYRNFVKNSIFAGVKGLNLQVTFRDEESAARACLEPAPVIEGRQANCNLASQGRPRPAPPYVHIRPAAPYSGGFPVPRGSYVGNSTYVQTFPYNYQQAIPYQPYGYPAFGPEYVYQQNVYTPYTGQQYLQFYGAPGMANPAVIPYGQFGQPQPSSPGFPTFPSYALPSHHQLMQLTGPTVNGVHYKVSHSYSSLIQHNSYRVVVQSEQLVERSFVMSDIWSRYPIDMQQDEELHCYSSGTLLALQAIIFCILEVGCPLPWSPDVPRKSTWSRSVGWS
uniref:RRM domain-containing protein n=1 Tax=Ananas comosus var. bracteatus TaxID=296719 RepID=A0A6V7PKD4_ANACO|nr:unnamed protein product [Ananas comosus var. bracteatus]